ncbi:MAG: T9SS type A sorting domain-containing protein [Flavobacteriales bacterium]
MNSMKIRHRKALKGLISPRSVALSGMFVAMLAGGTANAQVAGTTQTTNYHLPFSANENSVELPAPASLDLSRAQFSEQVSQTVGINYNSDAFSSAFSGLLGYLGITATTLPPGAQTIINLLAQASPVQGTLYLGPRFSFEAGVYIQANELTNSQVAIEYPVNVEVEFPQPNTFGCGDEFVIHTSYSVDGAPTLDVAPPFTDIEFGPILSDINVDLSLEADLELCVPGGEEGANFLESIAEAFTEEDIELGEGCTDLFTFNRTQRVATLDVPDVGPFFRFCEGAFQPNATNADLFACDPGTEVLWNVADDLVGFYDNYALCGPLSCDFGFVEYTPSEQKWDLHYPDLPSVGITPEIDGFVQKLPKDVLGSSFNAANGKLSAAGNKQIAQAEIDLLSLLPKPTTSISTGGGLLGLDLGDISPTLKVNQELSFGFQPKVHVRLDLGAPMQYRVVDNGVVVQDNMFGQYPQVLAGQDIVAVYPQALSSPLTVSNEFDMDGNFDADVVQKYTRTFNVRALKVNAFGYESPWAYETSTPETLMEIDTLAKGSILFDSFNAFNGASFDLDPENPIVEVDELFVQDVVNVGGGERLVVYKTGISNGGDVDLRDVIQNLDLGETFETAKSFTVECITSPDLDVNYDFNGKNDINLLADGNELEVGESGTIEILVRVKPAVSAVLADGAFAEVIYDASTTAYGTSPIGTVVESNYNQCTDETTASDIVASVDLGASVIDELADYTVYGTTQVDFQRVQALSRGNVGSTSEIKFNNTNTPNVIIGDLHSGSLLKLLGSSNVVCDYVQVGQSVVLNGSSILAPTGGTSYPSATTGVQTIPALVNPANNSSIDIAVGSQAVNLAPGNYRKVSHAANSVMNMSSGTYNIDTWFFAGNNAHVNYNTTNGPIIINVSKWQPLGRSGLKFVVTNGMNTPGVVQYNYTGNAPCNFVNTQLQGTINAPISFISFDSGSKLEGRCYADRIKFDRMSTFTDPLYMDTLRIAPACRPASLQYRVDEYVATELESDASAIALADAIGLYPNPNKGQLFNINIADVAAEEVFVSILDATGRLVYNNRYTTQGSLNTVVAFTEPLTSGLYMVQFMVDGVVTSKQMIVE